MNEPYQEQKTRAPVRRVGTFTVGVTLVAAGVLMLLRCASRSWICAGRCA